VVRSACESAVFLAVLAACPGCKPAAHQTAAASASAPAFSAPATPRLAPLAAANWLIDLDVPGFGKAALAVPIGAIHARPIVIALHGVAGRPEWICGAFRGIAGPTPFVLCPRGVARADFVAPDLRYTFASADDTARELRAALTELKKKFGVYVAPGPVIFGGFELGADHAAWIARQEPAFFSRLLVIDPASSTWDTSQAAFFGREGGARVLFAPEASAKRDFELKALMTRSAGAEARVVVLDGQPLALGPAAVTRLAQSWPWLAATPEPKAPQNLAGNALPVGGPVTGRPAP
jgi:hypothetical protein